MPAAKDSQLAELTGDEISRLTELEAVVERNITSFIEAGEALSEIRESKLYRNFNATFEGYCKVKWGIDRQRAYQLINAAEVVANVNHGLHPPTSERQTRPLAALPPAEQPAAWQEAVDTAPEGKVTAKHVAEVVARRNGHPKGDDKPAREFIDNAPMAALEKAEMESLGKTPKQEADDSPGKRWSLSFNKLYMLLNSMRDIGGVKKLIKPWSKPERKESAKELREIVRELQSWIKDLEN